MQILAPLTPEKQLSPQIRVSSSPSSKQSKSTIQLNLSVMDLVLLFVTSASSDFKELIATIDTVSTVFYYYFILII